jgi:MFS family permease
MQRHFLVLLVLALSQITGWGVVGILPVIAPSVAAELGSSLPSVFLGMSVMYVSTGLAAPWAGRAFRRFGTRQVMAVGAGAIGLALCLIALSEPAGILGGMGADRSGRCHVPDDLGLRLYRGLCGG